MTPDDDELAVTRVADLHLPTDRPDVIAAARFTVTRVLSGSRITTIDAYLLADSRVETWEDDGFPGVDHGGDYSGRAHPDWRPYIEPMLRAALRVEARNRKPRPSHVTPPTTRLN